MPISELLNSFLLIAPSNPIVVALVLGLLRGFIGWLEGVFSDWKANKSLRAFDVGKLLHTWMRIIPQSIGLGVIAPGAEIGALFSDYAIGKLPKKKK